MNNQFTEKQLDEIDKNKPHFKHIFTDHVEKELAKMGKFFQKNLDKSYLQPVALKLTDDGFSFKAIKMGLNSIIELQSKFPSYSEITASIRPFCTNYKDSNSEDKEYLKEQEKFEHYKNEMIRVMGEDGLARYFKWWKSVVPDFKIDKDFDSLYLKCAIFDWVDAGMSNNREKILQVGKAKFKRLENLP